MKKTIIAACMILLATSSFAALQYQVVYVSNGTQNWRAAYEIKLKITEGGSLWFSSFVSNWNSIPDLGTLATMTADNYGAGDTVGGGTTKIKTFTDNKGHQVSTVAYGVGNFEAGDEISFWITAPDGTVGSSEGLVGGSSGLNSRQATTVDLAGNVRFNFSFNSGTVEFVAFGGESTAPVGQPLPGVALGLLLGGGLFSAAAVRRRRKVQEKF